LQASKQVKIINAYLFHSFSPDKSSIGKLQDSLKHYQRKTNELSIVNSSLLKTVESLQESLNAEKEKANK